VRVQVQWGTLRRELSPRRLTKKEGGPKKCHEKEEGKSPADSRGALSLVNRAKKWHELERGPSHENRKNAGKIVYGGSNHDKLKPMVPVAEGNREFPKDMVHVIPHRRERTKNANTGAEKEVRKGKREASLVGQKN